MPDSSCVAFLLANRTSVEVEVLWLDADSNEEKSYLLVPSGEERSQESFPQHAWRCRAAGNGDALATLVLGPIDMHTELVSSTESSAGSSTSQPRCIDLLLSNGTGMELEVFWVDCQSDEETSYLRLPPGETHTQQSFPEHCWRLRGAEDGALYGAVTLGQANVHVTIGARAAPPAEGSTTQPSFYQQERAVGVAGVRVRAHESVSDVALRAASEVIHEMLRHSPQSLLVRLQEAGCSVAIIGREQLTSDVPEHAFLSGRVSGSWEYDATTRGVGGNPSVPVTSVGEENLVEDEATGADGQTSPRAQPCDLDDSFASSQDAPSPDQVRGGHADARSVEASGAELCVDTARADGARVEGPDELPCCCACCGAPAPSPERRLRERRRRDAYGDESILVHEFAHCVMDVGLDDDARARIRSAHAAALDVGLVDRETYIGSNASEFWAESVQAWFHATVRCDVNCGINSREELEERDPATARELRLAFGSGSWRYPHTLRTFAPRRAEAWDASEAKRMRVRSQKPYKLAVPLCQCLRKHRARFEVHSIDEGMKQWRPGQPLCAACTGIVEAAKRAGLR